MSSASRLWTATSESGWSAANIYGLPIGPTQIVGNLREGALAFNPIEATIGQGKITATPRIVFDPAPTQLQLAPGQIATRIAISQEMSETMLKYAAPILAGSTRSEGEFSAVLDGFAMPLADPQAMRAGGRVAIHRLSIQPGPMIQDVVNLISQLDALGKGQPLGALGALGGGGGALPAKQVKGVTMTDKTIDVQVADRRVYHRNLEFLIDDVPVRSYGSVGFDETLALEIEVPIQQKWVGKNKSLQGLVGQPIKIPVRGTFSKPQVDQRAVADLSRQFLEGAAAGAIGGELNRALDKLFKGK